jgi:hypothetical protein
MNTIRLTPLLAATLILATAPRGAAEEPAKSPAVSSNAVSEDRDSPVTQPRTLSASTAAKLNAQLPHYTPKPAAAGANRLGAPAEDRDFADSSVLQLPNYEIQERQAPDFRERELLTPKGRIDVAFRRHPGLRFGPFSSLNAKVGLMMLQEEQQVERYSEIKELTDLEQFGRDEESDRAEPVKSASAKPAAP